MIHFCVFKWLPDNKGLLPSQKVVDYAKIGSAHVNRMFSMVRRHLQVPHRFVCITDDTSGLDSAIDIVPLWNDCAELGGCYRRLKFFSKEMRSVIGRRIVQCDIDTIITGNITPLIDRPEPIALYRHHEHVVNGGLWIMDAGVRSDVWDSFDPQKSPRDAAQEIGTDQGWLKYYLGDDIRAGKIKTIGRKEGIYDMRADIIMDNRGKLPEDAKMVVFPGPRDPSNFQDIYWVKKYWH